MSLGSNQSLHKFGVVVPENGSAVTQDVSNKPHPLRISYIPGPGDVRSTFDYWRAGEHDPRIPSITYSAMFFELCRNLNALGQVIIRDQVAPPTEVFDTMRFDGVAYLHEDKRYAWLNGPTGYTDQIATHVNDFNPDIIIASLNLPFRGLKKLTGADRKIIITVHNTFWPMGDNVPSLKQRARRYLMGHYLSVADSAICTSHECSHQLQQTLRRDIPSVVAVPQQIHTFEDMSVAKYDKEKRFLYLGRIEGDKGVFDLLEAFEKVYRQDQTARLDYVGAGDADNELQTAVIQRGLEKQVRLHGRLPGREVHDILTNAYALVCPTKSSFYEGLAFVCFEAAVHGVPSIMTSVVPAQSLLNNSSIVTPADDPTALASAMEGLISDPGRRDKLSAKAKEEGAVTYDREKSWGSGVYKLIMQDGRA